MPNQNQKQQGATQAQLAHRALWLKLEVFDEVRDAGRMLDSEHRRDLEMPSGSPGERGARIRIRASAHHLLDVMAEAGL